MKQIILILISTILLGSCSPVQKSNLLETLLLLSQANSLLSGDNTTSTGTDSATSTDTSTTTTNSPPPTTTSSGGKTYTVWGSTSCASGYTVAYTGYIYFSVARDTTNKFGFTSDPVCLEKSFVDANSARFFSIAGITNLSPLCTDSNGCTGVSSANPMAGCAVCTN